MLDPIGLRDRGVLVAIGLVQGIVYWQAVEQGLTGEAGALLAAAVAFVSVAGLCAQLAWTSHHPGRLAATSLAIGAGFAAVTHWVCRPVSISGVPYHGDALRVPTWLLASFLALYILEPFVQIRQRSGGWRFPYGELFYHSWTNLFIGAMGCVYTAVFAALVLLWAGLFKLIRIDFFYTVFTSHAFVALSSMAVFGYGLAMGREAARFTDAGRTAALTVFRALLPLLSGIALLFLAAMPFTGLLPLWETGYASGLLLSLAGLVVLFLNAVFEDGERSPPYALAARRTVETCLVLLPVLSALTVYSLGLRIAQYGLSPQRFYGAIFAAVSSVFALGYAVAVFRRHGPWMGAIRPLNVRMALGVAALALLLHTPLLDPLGWSAWSQYQRLASGRVDAASFDFDNLRFNLGRPGYEALEKLDALEGHPEHELIRTRVAAARARSSFSDRRPDRRPVVADRRGHLEKDIKLGAGLGAIPDGLADFLAIHLRDPEENVCSKGGVCLLFEVELDARDPPEACLGIGSLTTRCFTQVGGKWKTIGELRETDALGAPLLDLLRTRPARPVPPRYQDVQIGDRVFQLEPDRFKTVETDH